MQHEASCNRPGSLQPALRRTISDQDRKHAYRYLPVWT